MKKDLRNECKWIAKELAEVTEVLENDNVDLTDLRYMRRRIRILGKITARVRDIEKARKKG